LNPAAGREIEIEREREREREGERERGRESNDLIKEYLTWLVPVAQW
jgi:hypothetical protein